MLFPNNYRVNAIIEAWIGYVKIYLKEEIGW